ncbi:MAG: trypsin-like peptidase domain-containing protein [Candidatus Bathyarchaeia archaeon]
MEQEAKRELSVKVVVLIVSVALVAGVLAGNYLTWVLNPSRLEINQLKEHVEVLSEKLSQIKSDQEVLKEKIEGISANLSELQGKIKTADRVFEAVAGSIVSIKVGVMQDGLVSESEGSGFVFSDEGYILTNNHVVEGFEAQLGIEVIFMDGTTVRGRFVSADPYSDIAVLKVDLPSGVRPLTLGNSSSVKVGEPVIAIGNPLGLGGSLTTGVVSQTHRSLEMREGFSIYNVIQFDAAVNPGNSGGPLLNYREEVIGITTATVPKLYGEGLGFAVPSNMVKRVATSLVERGEFKHPWIGIVALSLDLKIAEAMNLNVTRGVLIVDVVEGSPAESAGLRGGTHPITILGQTMEIGGDIIVQVDGVEVRTLEDLGAYLDEYKSPGDTINVTILRHGVKLTIPLNLGERPSP